MIDTYRLLSFTFMEERAKKSSLPPTKSCRASFLSVRSLERNSLGDFEYPEQPQRSQHADPERRPRFDHVPDHLEDAPHDHLQTRAQGHKVIGRHFKKPTREPLALKPPGDLVRIQTGSGTAGVASSLYT